MAELIESIKVPDEVRKCGRNVLEVNIYDEYVEQVFENNKSYFRFEDYANITWTRAGFIVQSETAYICFMGANAINPYYSRRGGNTIGFSSGLFSYKKANAFCVEVFAKIQKAFNSYKIKSTN